MKEQLKVFSLVIMLTVLSFTMQGQTKDTLVIKTSAQCEDCKERMETALAFEKGVITSDLNIKSKEITVVYKSNKTTPVQIRKSISKAGYDADEVKAEPKAYAKLPSCCKKGGHKECDHDHDHDH